MQFVDMFEVDYGGIILFMSNEGCSRIFIISPVAIYFSVRGNYGATYGENMMQPMR